MDGQKDHEKQLERMLTLDERYQCHSNVQG